jgi:predicted SAM-dependent methyltransferase
MKLHIGCGFDKKEGYINCDFSKDVKPDKVFDITKNWPFKDNQITEILMNHTLEHTQKPIEVMKEMYRICKNDAIIKIRVPYFSSESAFSMMDHYSFYTYTTFDFLEKNHPCHWQGFGNFKIITKKLIWRRELKIFEFVFNKIPRIYQELFCWWFPAKELYIELKVIK